jgi:hypothetical protein
VSRFGSIREKFFLQRVPRLMQTRKGAINNVNAEES